MQVVTTVLDCVNPCADLQWDPDTRRMHANAMNRLLQRAAKQEPELFDHMYTTLTILDGKTGALINFNAFVLVLCTLIFSPDILGGEFKEIGSNAAMGVIAAGTICSFVSAGVLLFVIRLHWSPTKDLVAPRHHIDRLLSLRNARTALYRFAWLLTFSAMLCLGVGLALGKREHSVSPPIKGIMDQG